MCAVQVSELTTSIDALYSRCFSGLEVEVEEEQQQQEPATAGTEASAGAAVAAAMTGAASASAAAEQPKRREQLGDVSEAFFGELGRSKPKVRQCVKDKEGLTSAKGRRHGQWWGGTCMDASTKYGRAGTHGRQLVVDRRGCWCQRHSPCTCHSISPGLVFTDGCSFACRCRHCCSHCRHSATAALPAAASGLTAANCCRCRCYRAHCCICRCRCCRCRSHCRCCPPHCCPCSC